MKKIIEQMKIKDFKYTPEQKLFLSLRLYHSAKALKTAAMKKFYSKKSGIEIEKK